MSEYLPNKRHIVTCSKTFYWFVLSFVKCKTSNELTRGKTITRHIKFDVKVSVYRRNQQRNSHFSSLFFPNKESYSKGLYIAPVISV